MLLAVLTALRRRCPQHQAFVSGDMLRPCAPTGEHSDGARFVCKFCNEIYKEYVMYANGAATCTHLFRHLMAI